MGPRRSWSSCCQILLTLALVAASYRQVVMAYTRAGGRTSWRGRASDHGLNRAAREGVEQAKHDYPDTVVTVLLPRRMYSPLADRLLHDRTADKKARVISRIPGASAQILAYDIGSLVVQAIRASDIDGQGHCPDTSEKTQATAPAS